MKNIRGCGIPFALSALAVCAATAVQAAPTSGDYVTDPGNTWVQDRVGDRIGTVNMIMCVIGSLRGDAMVNQGAYVALVDSNKCEGRGDSSKSTSTSAGASNATDYMSAVVTATQASSTDPLVIKGWLSQEEDMGSGPEKMTIYIHVTATAGKSAEHPNGLFEMYFCGKPDSMPDTHGGGLADCMFRGSLQSNANGLSFYEEEADQGHGAHTTQLILQSSGADTGSGRISGSEGNTPFDYTFAYNAAQFCRTDGTTESCFSREADNGDYSTWRYGTYNSDGSRLEVANPGFPVKFEYNSKTYYGFWSFWGLWLPEAALNNLSQGVLTRRVGDSDVTLTTEKHGGKLWKLTRTSATLADLKSVPMMLWVHQTMGALSGGANYEVKWDGTSLLAVGKTVCGDNGCAPEALPNPVTIDADDLRAAFVRALPVFFPAGGGNGMVKVPASGEFDGTTDVFYRTRDLVKPTDPSLNLDCVTQCPKSGSDLTTALTSNQSPFMGSWGHTDTRHSYTFTGGDLTHDGNANAQVDASGVNKDQMGGYMWGVNSGAMIAHAQLDSIRCDVGGANPAGTYFCPDLIEQADVIYQWETGPNQWNQYFGATGVTIDPPKVLNLAANYVSNGDPANTIFGSNAASYHGNNLQLQFSGFGELQGIPGGCVNPDTNAAVNCDQNTRWVPAFNLADGAGVSDGSATYYVRFLERELRLSTMPRDGASPTLPSGGSLTLPTSALIAMNARTENGAAPTPANSEPAVIHGTVQEAAE